MKFSDCKTKKARIDFIKNMLRTNRVWATKGLLRIYERQTASEQASQTTHDHNGVGFTGADAEILSSFAQQVLGNRFVGSEKQLRILHHKMPKYARQLEGLATTISS